MSTHTLGTIREATLEDGPALTRLFRVTAIGRVPVEDELATWLAEGRLLVLELTPNTVGAAAYVALSRSPEGCHASLPLLAIHPALAKCGIEDRLAREVIALCDRIGVVDLDVTCEPTHPTRRAS